MSKGTIKILAIVLILLLMSTGIVIKLSNNKSQAYDESDILNINLTTREFGWETNEYYCLNKGLEYAPGRYIYMGEGTLKSKVAYAIGYEQKERNLGKTDPDDDAIANIVWAQMGTTHNGETILESDEYLEIIDAADIIQNMTDDDISITLQSEEIIENAEGEYGPFQIDYPYIVIQENVIGEFTIIVNGETELKIDDLIKKEDGYYLTENQGIKEGEQNTVKIKYTANQYSGTYVKYVREQEIYRDCRCPECEEVGYGTILGWYNNGDEWELNENEEWKWSEIEHKDDCSKTMDIDFDSSDDWYTKDNYQDIIEPEIVVNPKPISDEVTFYAGKPKLELYVHKVDTDGNGLDGAGFQVDGVSQENTEITQDGGLIIKADAGEDSITVKLTETKAPDGYVKLEEPIKITYVWNSSQRKWICDTEDFKFSTGEAITIIEDEDNRYTIKVENRKMITISGQVWLDEQTGTKPVSPPNGKKDGSEGGISGIQVNLKDSNNKIIATTATGSNGDYKFINIPSGVSYYVEFVYDGINYIATDIKGDSEATEVNRTAFNDKFYTITRKLVNGTMKDIAISANGNTITELDYDSAGKIQTMKGNTVNSKYAITAKTESATYNEDTTGIDLGLVKKDVDLSAVTEIYSATVKINGKTTEYGDITGLEKDDNGVLILENPEEENVQYSLYLYNSDYNYRIRDYKLPATRKDYLTVNNSKYANTAEPDKDANTQLLAQRLKDGELSVEVTYQVLLNNQSATNAKINEIAYYYDTNYEIGLADGVTPELVKINGKTYNKVVMTVNQWLTDKDNQIVESFTFTVKKDSSGNVYTGEVRNWVEIVSYSTNDGCIDYDSAPNNIENHRQEDDTDDAAGLNIQLNHIEREVSGYVFEDTKSNNSGEYNTGNGEYNESEGDKKIDDVIVQLIEIKNVTIGSTTLKLEYIWQETVSGSTTVKYMPVNGQFEDKNSNGKMDDDEIPTYPVTNEPGHYTFNQNIIPGNYIVRFIYGDGTYYDTAGTITDPTTGVTKKTVEYYNGQDYKSTIDIGYNKNPITVAGYSSNSSMARDNEARRLEQMAYAKSLTSADVELLKIDSQDELNNTWMCAETSLISMNISENISEGDSDNSITRNANFGLVERPRALLQLEKHITGLKIEGIIEATTTLENYDNALADYINNYSDVVTNKGIIVENSTSIDAEATNKEYNKGGRWLIQTDTNKVGGQRLEITYTYRIKNIGDIEYIGRDLKNKSSVEYKQIADSINNNTDTDYYIGKYLGTAYYTGTKNDNDNNVESSIPVQVEDYISTGNGGLKLDSTSKFTNAGTAEKSVWKYSNKNGAVRAVNDITENVNVIQSTETLKVNKDAQTLILKVYNEGIDSTSSADSLTYRSYAAQLIYPTTGTVTSDAGTLCDNSITLGNLGTLTDGTYHGGIKSDVDVFDKSKGGVEIKEIVPELDEAIAETVIITLDTGADKQTPMILITTITAGLAVVAVGVVLIKKFIIK